MTHHAGEEDFRDVMIENKLERLLKERNCKAGASALTTNSSTVHKAKNVPLSTLLGRITVSLCDLERRISNCNDEELKAICMAHILKYRLYRIWYLYSSLIPGVDRPADTMDEQLENVLASETHYFQLVRECHVTFSRKIHRTSHFDRTAFYAEEIKTLALRRYAMEKFRRYTSCLLVQLTMEGFAYHMHDEVVCDEDIFELLPEGKDLALFSPDELWFYSDIPKDFLRYLQSVGQSLLNLVKGLDGNKTSAKNVLAHGSHPFGKDTGLLLAQLKGYFATSELHDGHVLRTADVEDMSQVLSDHSVVCSYDELLKMSVVRDERLRQSYIEDIWLALNILLESNILSWEMLRPVLSFVKSGLELKTQKQVDIAPSIDVLGYMKDLPILWVQELRDFFISHLGLRGQLATAFYRSVQDQREEQCVLDIELDGPDGNDLEITLGKISSHMAVPANHDAMGKYGEMMAANSVELEELEILYSEMCSAMDIDKIDPSHVPEYEKAHLAFQNLREFTLYQSQVQQVIIKSEIEIAELRPYASAIVDRKFEVCNASDVQDVLLDLVTLVENLSSEIIRWNVGKRSSQLRYHNSQLQAITCRLTDIENEISEITSAYCIEKTSPRLQTLPPKQREYFLHLHQTRDVLVKRRQNYYRQRHIGHVQHMHFLQVYHQYSCHDKDVSFSPHQIFGKVAWTYSLLDPSGTLQGIVKCLVDAVESLLLRVKTVEENMSVYLEAKYLRARQCAVSCSAASLQNPPSELLFCARDLFRERVEQAIKEERERDARESEISLLHQLDEEKAEHADKEKVKSRKIKVKKKKCKKYSCQCPAHPPHLHMSPVETPRSFFDEDCTDVKTDIFSGLQTHSSEELSVNLQGSTAHPSNPDADVSWRLQQSMENGIQQSAFIGHLEPENSFQMNVSLDTSASIPHEQHGCHKFDIGRKNSLTGWEYLQDIHDTKLAKQGNGSNRSLDESEKCETDAATTSSLQSLPGQALNLIQPENLSSCVFGGIGLQNRFGEYNCFLNVIIQCLWHLPSFRKALIENVHPDQSNDVVRALHRTFIALDDMGAKQRSHSLIREEHVSGAPKAKLAVSPSELRKALSAVQGENIFPLGEMNDAAEVLEVLWSCMKEVPLKTLQESMKLHENRALVDVFFGLDIHENLHCGACDKETRKVHYRQYCQTVPAIAVQRNAAFKPDLSMGSVIHMVLKSHTLPCGLDDGGCGVENFISIFLKTPPLVFILELVWASEHEPRAVIQETLHSVEDCVDLGEIYSGLEIGMHSYMLKSMVGYCGSHYKAFVLMPDLRHWMMLDDENISTVGTWQNVKEKCLAGRVQPSVLFYDSFN